MAEANKKLGSIDDHIIKNLVDELHKLKNDYYLFREDNSNNMKNM